MSACAVTTELYWKLLAKRTKKRKKKLCLHYTNYVLTMYQNIHSQSYYVSLVSLWWIKQPLFVIVQYCSIFFIRFQVITRYIRSKYIPGKLTISERKWMLPKVDLCSQPRVATLLIHTAWIRIWMAKDQA